MDPVHPDKYNTMKNTSTHTLIYHVSGRQQKGWGRVVEGVMSERLKDQADMVSEIDLKGGRGEEGGAVVFADIVTLIHGEYACNK